MGGENNESRKSGKTDLQFRLAVANVHFVMRDLRFPCLSVEYKDNAIEIQRKCNGNPSHAQQNAHLVS